MYNAYKCVLILLIAELLIHSASGDESSGETAQPAIDESKVCDLSVAKVDRTSDSSIHCGDCDFDSDDLCGYRSVPEDVSWDHASQYSTRLTAIGETGRFMYTKEKYLQLHTPYLRNSYKDCVMKFNYAFSEWEKSDLKLYLTKSGQRPIEIWTITEATSTSDKPDVWHNGSAYIGQVNGIFNAHFVSIFKSRSNDVYTAVDNIVFEGCALPSKTEHCDQFKCANGVCVDKSTVCDFSNDCGDNSDEKECDDYKRMDFDSNLMEGWSGYNNTDANDWRLVEAILTYPIAKRPTRDHKTNDGDGSKYVMVYNSSNPLVSPMIKNSEMCLMRFYVNSCIKGIGHLEVKVNSDHDQMDKHVATLLHNQTLYFRRYVIDFTNAVSKNTPFHVKMTAHIVKEVDSLCHYFAVDDISFTPECFKNGEESKNPTMSTSTSKSDSQHLFASAANLAINLITLLILKHIIH